MAAAAARHLARESHQDRITVDHTSLDEYISGSVPGNAYIMQHVCQLCIWFGNAPQRIMARKKRTPGARTSIPSECVLDDIKVSSLRIF